MMGAPSDVTPKQLRELNIRVVAPEPKAQSCSIARMVLGYTNRSISTASYVVPSTRR